ncbi:MAG: type II toxin-antitoxin system VapC family toxin [Opitutaceae bacterium]
MPNALTAERVLVDTSIWVDFFRAKAAAVALIEQLARQNTAVICGTVMQETTQGGRTEKELDFLHAQMSLWYFEAEQPEDFRQAAAIYARLRWRGVTVPPADCLIASVALRCDFVLCAADAHYARIPGLKLHDGR